MRLEDFEAMYELEESLWWFPAMRRIVETIAAEHLSKPGVRILDAGCGTGFNVQYFASGAREVYGFDIAFDAMEFARRRKAANICQASVTEIPFASNSFDLAFSLDSISHVPLDLQGAGLAELRRVLRHGGALLIRTPAYEWMRSSHDEGMGNTRRFTVSELSAKLAEAGFSVRWASYANCFLFPIAAATRLLKAAGVGRGSDVKALPRLLSWMNPVLREVLASEAAVFRRGGRLPFGLSVIALGEK